MKSTGVLFILIFVLYALLVYIYLHNSGFFNSIYPNRSVSSTSGKCSATSCNSIDPVSDPKYNMQQIVKQSILLEEHLANKNKRCRDCITKHFLHIIGLSEEAQMLATNRVDQYPLVNECVETYNRLFKIWLKHHDVSTESNVLFCCDELRTMRKKLIAVYFFDDNYKVDNI